MLNRGYRIALYLRLSVEDGDAKDESNSITNQRLLLHEHIISDSSLSEQKDREIAEYKDDGYSGTNFNRPGLKTLLEDVKSGVINCIVVKDLSRFGRDYIEIGTYLDQIFPFLGVRFISVNDGYDSLSHKGQTVGLDTQFKMLIYDFYSKDLSTKYKNAIMSKCEQGQYVFGRLPLGYEKIPNTKHETRINEYEANIVKRIYKETIEGKSTNAIARGLHEDGVPTYSAIRGVTIAGGRKTIWQGATVSKILNNRFYIGEWSYNKVKVTSVGSKKLVKRPKDEWKIVPDHHQILICQDDFNKAQECLARNSRNHSSNLRKGEKHPLTGKIYCGGCGYALTYKKECRKNYFRCDYTSADWKKDCCKGANAAVLEELVLVMLNQELIKLTEFHDLIGSQKQELKMRIDKEKSVLYKHEKDLSEREREKQALYLKYAKGDLSVDSYKAEARKIEDDCLELADKVENIGCKIAGLMKEYRKDYKNLKELLSYSGVVKLTEEVVELFIKKLYLYDGNRVEIQWAFNEI